MQKMSSKPYRRWPVQLAGLVLVSGLAGMAQLPVASDDELKELSSRFRFDQKSLPGAPVPPGIVFGINPSVRHLRGWLYHVGASIAMADLDGDGLSNDLVYTDIRGKALMIAPAPGTGDRFAPFSFDFGAHVDLKTQHPLKCGVSDMNEDGLADIYVGFGGRAPLLLLRKDMGAQQPEALSSASFVVQDLIPDGIKTRWISPTHTFSDIDGDGHVDLLVGNYFPDGTNLYDETSTQLVEMNDTFVRAMNGGNDRIYLWAGAKGGESPEVMYKAVGENSFPNGEGLGWTFAFGAQDFDRDGLSDLYVANDFGADRMYMNRSMPGKVNLVRVEGEQSLTDPRSFVIGKDTFKGMGIDFADINHDGMFDIAISNISNRYALGESHYLWVSHASEKSRLADGVAPYENKATELGTWHNSWGWDIRFDDFDLDGGMEIVQATGYMTDKTKDNGQSFFGRGSWTNLQQFSVMQDRLVKDPRVWPQIDFGSEVDGHSPNPFYVMGKEGRYIDVSAQVFPGLYPNSRGIATADVDGDGRLEMVYSRCWEDSLFFTNQSPDPGRFLGLHLLLPLQATGEGSVHEGHPKFREGSPAVGAVVEFEHDGKLVSRQVDGGNGHAGSRSPDLVFGLGRASKDTQLSVRVTWRDRQGAVQRTNLQLRPGWHTVTLAAKVAQ